jgi:hypothetical protein
MPTASCYLTDLVAPVPKGMPHLLHSDGAVAISVDGFEKFTQTCVQPQSTGSSQLPGRKTAQAPPWTDILGLTFLHLTCIDLQPVSDRGVQ